MEQHSRLSNQPSVKETMKKMKENSFIIHLPSFSLPPRVFFQGVLSLRSQGKARGPGPSSLLVFPGVAASLLERAPMGQVLVCLCWWEDASRYMSRVSGLLSTLGADRRQGWFFLFV